MLPMEPIELSVHNKLEKVKAGDLSQASVQVLQTIIPMLHQKYMLSLRAAKTIEEKAIASVALIVLDDISSLILKGKADI